VPVPVSAIVCGLLAASSVMVTAPDLTPLSLGLKATRIVQLSPAGKLEPQLSITSKSPLTPMLEMLKVVGPVFVSVAV